MSSKLDTRTRILKTTWQLMEQRRGQDVRMSDIAKEAGISRQAVYLHFGSRTELMIATAHYVDEAKGLNERLTPFQAATTGVEMLEIYVEIWGNYIPEIYGLGKVLLGLLETDEAAAAAWSDRMSLLRDGCQEIIETLAREDILAPEWSSGDTAVEMFWTILSVRNWEQLTIECGWSTSQYIARMQTLLKRTFIDQTKIVE